MTVLSADPQLGEEGAALRLLIANAARFEFTQAVAIIQQANPQAPPIGRLGPPEQEVLRLRPALELSFASSDLGRIMELPPPAGEPVGMRYVLECRFMGLYGQASPLPTYFTENLLALDNAAPERAFIDIFNHRLLSLAYRVMTKYRFTESPQYRERLLSLVGMSPADTSPADGSRIEPSALLACAGLLSQQPRSAAALEGVLAYWLEAPVAIDQCVEQWIDLPRDRQTQLGPNFRLGIDATCGERVFDRSTSFRVVIGPVTGEGFRALLPEGPDNLAVHELVAEFNAECLDYQLEVLVRASDLPAPQLQGVARLGWDTRMVGDPTSIIRIRFTNSP